MKSKKIPAVILAMIMACALLASCGGGSQPSPSSAQPSPASLPPQPQAPAANDDEANRTDEDGQDEDGQDEAYPDEVYKEMMLAFEDGFTELLHALIDSVFELDLDDSEDDIDNWRKSLSELRDEAENGVALLTDMESLVAEKYAEAHHGYTRVAEYVLDSLTTFYDAVETAFDEGDEDAAIIACNGFLNDMLMANEEWLIARSGLASIWYAEEAAKK